MNNKVIIIGLDGATWKLIDPLLDKDELPTFKKLISNGTRGILNSFLISASPSAWTTLATGCDPNNHGIFDFTYRKENTYEEVPYSSRDRKRDTIWEILSRNGKKVGILNVPGTYPVDKVNGFMISGFPMPEDLGDFTYPKELLQELKKEFGMDFRIQPQIAIKEEKSFLEEMRLVTNYAYQATVYLMENKSWDFFITVFMASDAICHAFWKYMDHKHPMYDEKAPDEFKHAIYEVYKDFDRKIKQLYKMIESDTVLIIMSDHGFGPLHYGVSINNWLLNEGYISLKKNLPTKARYWMFQRGLNFNNLLKITKALNLTKHASKVAYSKKSFVKDIVNKFFITNMDFDWNNTKAYCMGSAGQLFINLKGREPKGIVEPNVEYDILVDELVNKLHKLKDPNNNSTIFNLIKKKKDFYPKSRVNDNLPDIIFLDKEMKYGLSRFFVFGSKDLISKHPVWSGTHMQDGIFLAFSDNKIRKSTNIKGANLSDITPTVLHIMGIPIPQNMDGKVLSEIFEKDSEIYKRKMEYQRPSKTNEMERINSRIKELIKMGKIK